MFSASPPRLDERLDMGCADNKGREKAYRDNLFIANFLNSTEFITFRLFW